MMEITLMERRRHPLAEKLAPLSRRRDMTIPELEATIDMAQRETEYWWEAGPPFGFTETMRPFPGPARCSREGCNYRRYPASRFCFYHVVGHDTFAERLRRAKARAKRSADNAKKPPGQLT
jgi:hypothetical protein